MIVRACFTAVLFCLAGSISWVYNPGCDDDTVCGRANMLHVLAKHQQYLWGTEHGLAGIVFSQTNDLAVNWTKYNEKDLSVSVESSSTFGWSLTSLYLENKTHNQTLDLARAPWKPIQIDNSTDRGDNLTFGYSNGFITVQVHLSNESGRMEEDPKLRFSENSTLVDIGLDITSIPGFYVQKPRKARLGIELASGNTYTPSSARSFDDSHTPALFRYDILYDAQPSGVYMMWRPVVYTDAKRSVISSLNMGGPSNKTGTTSSLLTKYYEESDVSCIELELLPPDGSDSLSDSFYWTVAMGLGKPETEGLSLVGSVLTVLIVGLPCLAVIGGGLLILYRRRSRNPGQGYRPI